MTTQPHCTGVIARKLLTAGGNAWVERWKFSESRTVWRLVIAKPRTLFGEIAENFDTRRQALAAFERLS